MAHHFYLSSAGSKAGARQYTLSSIRPATQPYALSWAWIVLAGLVATFAITLMMYLVPPLIGMQAMDVGTMLGTMFLPNAQVTAFWVGMTWHFVNGIVFVLVYAMALMAFHKQSTWFTGAWFGTILWLIGPMLLMPVMLTLHPLVPEEFENPGYFMLDMGQGLKPAAFDLVAHLVYGVIAGVMYKHRVRPDSKSEATVTDR